MSIGVGASGGGGSKATAKPTYWPGQKEAYTGVMNMMSAYMGLPTQTTTTTTPTSVTSPLYTSDWYRKNNANSYGRGRYNPTPVPTTTVTTTPAVDERGQAYLTELLAPYGGDLSAALTDMQKKSLATIGAYQPGELYKAGSQNILDTLSGKYNPIDSPYYAAMRAKLLSTGEDAVTSARQNANLYGGLSSTGMANVETKARASTANDINAILGTLFESERNRQTGILPTAMQYEQYPLTVAGQQLQAGTQEQGINQAALDRNYQEFIRQLTALGIPLQTIMNLIGAPIGTEQNSKTDPKWGFNLGVK
jgi:hypothetical protein